MKNILQRPFSILFFALCLSANGGVFASDLSEQNSGLAGVWKTEGYGYLFDIGEADVSIYEVTSISCLKSVLIAGKLQISETSDIQAQFPVSLEGFIDAVMEVQGGEGRNNKTFHRTDTSTFMVANRLEALPCFCMEPGDKSATNTHAIFSQTFAEHYPFFAFAEDKGAAFQGDINADISESALFASLVGMIKPLHDSHTALVAPSLDEMYFGHENSERSKPEDARMAGSSIVDQRYLTAPLQYYCNQKIGFSHLADDIGYLRIDGFFDYTKTGNQTDDIVALNKAMDAIFVSSPDMGGLIIDLRTNSGGSDMLAIELARRFTARKYLAYSKQAVEGAIGGVVWTATSPTWVTPAEGALYQGPIVLLTGPDSQSAAETFTMGMMGRSPNVIRVGDNTRGSFSDMLPRALPNGWLFALPNERFVDAVSKSYDRVGIAPDVRTGVFSDTDLKKKQDSALDAAITLLIER